MIDAPTDGGSEVTEVVWAATSPVSGHFNPVETRSDIEVLTERFAELRARGEGYLEMRRADDYPVLTLGFREHAAVVQGLTSLEEISILKGDGSCQRDLLEVPILDDVAVFSGPAGIDLDHAWSLTRDFLMGRDLSELGEWIEL